MRESSRRFPHVGLDRHVSKESPRCYSQTQNYQTIQPIIISSKMLFIYNIQWTRHRQLRNQHRPRKGRRQIKDQNMYKVKARLGFLELKEKLKLELKEEIKKELKEQMIVELQVDIAEL
jgi:hypothetical protein